MTRPLRAVAVAAAVVTLAGVAAFGGAAYAAHQFSDVSDANPFHDEIAAMADAGITTGYDDGTFRPGAPLTRQAMAAFLARGLGRATVNAESDDLTPGESTADLGTIELTSPVDEGSGSVLVHADVNVETTDTENCPCRVLLQLNGDTKSSGLRGVTLGGEADGAGGTASNASLTHLFELPGGATRTYSVSVTLLDLDVSEVTVSAVVSTTYVPYGELLSATNS